MQKTKAGKPARLLSPRESAARGSQPIAVIVDCIQPPRFKNSKLDDEEHKQRIRRPRRRQKTHLSTGHHLLFSFLVLLNLISPPPPPPPAPLHLLSCPLSCSFVQWNSSSTVSFGGFELSWLFWSLLSRRDRQTDKHRQWRKHQFVSLSLKEKTTSFSFNLLRTLTFVFLTVSQVDMRPDLVSLWDTSGVWYRCLSITTIKGLRAPQTYRISTRRTESLLKPLVEQ